MEKLHNEGSEPINPNPASLPEKKSGSEIEIKDIDKEKSQPETRPPEYFAEYYERLNLKNTKREIRNRQSDEGIEMTLDSNQRIAIMKPIFYGNPEKSAEQLRELVCTTDENGNFTHEKLTRREAREQNKRYLISTALIFYKDKLLVQKRSENKDIDPGKLSASAHGVAKDITYEFSYGEREYEDRRKLTHESTAIVNTALEIFEELYHNKADLPIIKMWPGNKEELYQYDKKYNINEPNTIYLIPEAYLPDDGYPLGDHTQKRSRGISSGYIFSQNPPEFSIDPHELSGVELHKPADLVNNPDASEDLKRLLHKFAGDSLHKEN